MLLSYASTVVSRKGPMGGAPYKFAKEGGGHCFVSGPFFARLSKLYRNKNTTKMLLRDIVLCGAASL